MIREARIREPGGERELSMGEKRKRREKKRGRGERKNCAITLEPDCMPCSAAALCGRARVLRRHANPRLEKALGGEGGEGKREKKGGERRKREKGSRRDGRSTGS